MDFLPEEIENYVAKHSEKEPTILNELNHETWEKVLIPRMLSGHIQGRVLSMLTHMINPKNVLEIGTYTGYSAICFAEGLQKDGKIILIGSAKAAYQSDYAMVRYHTDGRIDKSFGNKGKVLTNVSKYGDVGTSIANQPDGKILLAGNSKEWASHITLLRYDANGKLAVNEMYQKVTG